MALFTKNDCFKQLIDINDLKEQYDMFIFDVWGVVVEGSQPYPGVAEVINRLSDEGKLVVFLSNAPRPSAASITKMSTEFGVHAKEGYFFTSGQLALDIINNSALHFGVKDAKIYNIGSDRNNDILASVPNLEVTDISDANALLITAYRDEGEDIKAFDSLLKQASIMNLPAICANPDIKIINGTKWRYCAGYFARKYEELGGTVIYTGKPHSLIYEKMAASFYEKRINIPRSRIVMVGDTFETDILGANRFGIESALVMTGNARMICDTAQTLEEKLEVLRQYSIKNDIHPSHIVKLV